MLWSHLNVKNSSVLMYHIINIYIHDKHIKKWAQSDAWEAQKCSKCGCYFDKYLMLSDVHSVASSS